MKRVTLTCPFTGAEFIASLNSKTGSLVATNIITGELIEVPEKYAELFFMQAGQSKSPIEAADYLGTTRQYLTELLRNGKLPHFKIFDAKRIPTSALVEYRQHRR